MVKRVNILLIIVIGFFMTGCESFYNDVPKEGIPVITLTGGDSTVTVGSTFTEPTCTAIDEEDGELECFKTGSYNLSKAGTYTLTYTAYDSDGNEAEAKVFTITVQEEELSYEGSIVTTSGYQLFVDGELFFIQGVCWAPVDKGYNHATVNFAGNVERDAKLMKEAGINVVRSYSPITDLNVLDILYENGIYVVNTVGVWGQI